MSFTQLQTGVQQVSDGSNPIARAGKGGDLIVSELNGRYYENSYRGNTFSSGVTGSGVAPGTALSTTAPFALYNPAGSGKNLVILRSSAGYISGTIGAGTVFYCANTVVGAAPTTGSALTVVNNLIGSGTAAVGKPFVTATLPVAPTILRPFFSLTAILASTAVNPYQVEDEIAGEFIVAPGATFSIEAVAAAGTTPLLTYGISWVETSI